MDQVPGVLAQRPRALVVAGNSKSQVRGDSARAKSVSGQKMQGRTAYFSGWMLTRSNPRTCSVRVSLWQRCVSFERAHLSVQIFAAPSRLALRDVDCRLRHPTHSAMSIAQMPVPQPTSRMRGCRCGCTGTGALCSWSLRATANNLW
jgi:hypothetical protein